MPRLLVLTLTVPLLILSACAQEKRFTQPNSAMEPTVIEGEKIAADMDAYHNSSPARGDIVVFHHDDILMLKRVVAIEGDTIEGRDFQIILNGAPIHEAYVEHTGKNPIAPQLPFLRAFGPVRIGASSIFVMGDNRDFSHDSRDPSFGTIPITEVRGRAVRIVKSNDARREGTAIQ